MPRTSRLSTIDHAKPPRLYAIVDEQSNRVLARGMSKAHAAGYAKAWKNLGGKCRTVRERLEFQPAESLLATS
jgi:hypothetical protein